MNRIVEALVRYGIHPDDAERIARRWTVGESVARFLRRYAEAFESAADEFSPSTACSRRSEAS